MPPSSVTQKTPEETSTDLEGVDEGQVVEGDVVVVVLDVAEGPLMVAHQRVDLAVLALLDLVDLRLPPQLQLLPQLPHLLLVLVLDFCHKHPE